MFADLEEIISCILISETPRFGSATTTTASNFFWSILHPNLSKEMPSGVLLRLLLLLLLLLFGDRLGLRLLTLFVDGDFLSWIEYRLLRPFLLGVDAAVPALGVTDSWLRVITSREVCGDCCLEGDLRKLS